MNDIAHELWAAAQLAPGEGIEDGVARLCAILSSHVLMPIVPTPAMCRVITNEPELYGAAEDLYAMLLQAAQGERNAD